MIPKMPMSPLIDPKDKVSIHPNWRTFFYQFITHLQQNIGQEGIVAPPVSDEDLATLNSPKSMQHMVYNTDQSAMMINNSGTYQQVATAAGVSGVTTQTTVGAAGSASPTPASPDLYENVNINGTQYARPLYKVS